MSASSEKREHGYTFEEIGARVVASRAAQGLPPTIENPTTIQNIVTLLRSAAPPTKQRKRRAS